MESHLENVPIIRTKLNTPRLVSDLVPRPHLFERLDSSLEKQLTLISAPAGYGKTTLVASWLQVYHQPVCWITLDENDNDLLRFLRYVVAAVRTIFPDAGEDVYKITRADYTPPSDYLAALLINDISDMQDSIVLVLDEFHLIDDVSVRAFVSAVIDNQPSNLHLVIISRTDPFLPSARLRASGKMTEIRSPDLRFQNDQARRFLTQAMETTINQKTASALNARTEGWITGLRLIALSASSEEELYRILAGSRLRSITFVNEYLLSEVLLQLPDSSRAFMLQSSILNRLSGPLCDAVALIDDADWSSQAYLGWLKEANVFVFALDDQGEWYRFHHLFQALLNKELLANYSKNEINELHQRASRWFAGQGLVEEAMYHALKAEDIKLAATIVEKNSQNLLNSLERHTLEKWLSLLPQDLIWQRPRLTLAKAWLLYREWRLTEMELTLSKAEGALADGELPEKESIVLQAQIATLRSAISYLCYQDYEQSLRLAERALAYLPKTAIGARGIALAIKGVAIQALGNLETAVHLLDSTIMSPILPDTAKIQPFIGLAVIHHAAAQLAQMSLVISRFLILASKIDSPNALASANKWAGHLYYERNDLTQALDHFTTTLEHRYQSNFLAAFDASLGLARIYLVQGRFEKGQATVDELRRETLRVKSSDLLGPLEAFQAYLWLAQGTELAALNWARSIEPQTVYESIVLSEVADLTRARILIDGGSPVEISDTVTVLKKKLEGAQKTHFTLRIIQIRVHLALAYDRLSQREQALNELEQALVLAQPGGFIRSFADMGPAILPLLNQLRESGVHQLYLEQIIESMPDSEFSARPRIEQDPAEILLTPRQTEILTLLRKGYSYHEIADELSISLNTVKKHISNIYEKLEVNNRQQAIYKADAIGMLL
jgi:LuxR family maltose regulon positive regulatory protein